MLEKIISSANYIKSKISETPSVGIILGSGLGIYVDKIKNKTIIPYDDIPFFKKTSVEGHSGALIVGEVDGVTVAALSGRIHPY
jgi:purine-nucleoside phosphorylase